jgi:hypothetical protein
VSENVSAIPAVLGVVGALSYGALNVAATTFYEPLGVTPSEVGLGYGELLARTAVVVAVLGAMAVAGFVFVGAAVHGLIGRLGGGVNGAARLRVRDRVVVATVGTVVLGAYDVMLSASSPVKWSSAQAIGIATFSLLVAFAVLICLVFVAKHSARKCGLTERHVLIVGLCLVFAAPSSFVAFAREGRREVQLGHRQRAVFGSPLPWQVTFARVTWKDSSRTAPDCLLYLGSSGSAVVFYDPNSAERRSLRLPASDVIVEYLPDRATC